MNVLTIQSVEELPAEIRTNIHFTFRMEHHTDYILTDRESDVYTATISMQDTSVVIETIVKNSTAFPSLTFIIDDLDMEGAKIERYYVRNGKIKERKTGSLLWKD